jgi:hypothetical protein
MQDYTIHILKWNNPALLRKDLWSVEPIRIKELML